MYKVNIYFVLKIFSESLFAVSQSTTFVVSLSFVIFPDCYHFEPGFF